MLLSYDWQRSNFGDILNKYIFSYLLESYKLSHYENCDVIGAGSIVQYNLSSRLDSLTMFRRNHAMSIWGAGLITDSLPSLNFKRNMNIFALRGRLTADILRKSQKAFFFGEALGDPGLVLPDILNVRPRLKATTRFGLVLHYLHKYLAEDYLGNPEVKIIDVCSDPIHVINQINECSIIVSTSLHGLIIAHSLNKQTVYATALPDLVGSHFKFMDYFSIYGHNASTIPSIVLSSGAPFKSIDATKCTHRIPYKEVLDVKLALLRTFPYAKQSKNLPTLMSYINASA